MKQIKKDDVKSSNRTFNLAVYGTLRTGGSLHSALGDAEYLGSQIVNGFDLYDEGSYPLAVAGTGKILVELYVVKEDRAKTLDEIEEGYHKEKIVVLGREALIYIYDNKEKIQENELSILIKNPDWLGYENSKKEFKVQVRDIIVRASCSDDAFLKTMNGLVNRQINPVMHIEENK